MSALKRSFVILVIITGTLFLAGTAIASPGIQIALGDDVPLSGYSTAGPFVYLFLTGPNLPENGVALNDITRRADQGEFTTVSVDGDDHWSYTWHTGSINGRLDEGTYTVWVVDGPNDRSRLAFADFQTIAITLGKPFVTVDTPVQNGGMDLQSVPDGASVTVSGEYRGKTPLTQSDISPGNYTVTFSRPGFMDLSARVPVQAGKTSEVSVTLQPENASLAVNSSPPGARVLLDGADNGFSPVVLANLTPGNHTVLLERDGYIPASRQVMITAGRNDRVDITLDPVPTASPTPAATRADSSGMATAGAFVVVMAGVACNCRRHR